MNNIYIFKIEDFTEQDALLVKKFDKSDKVIFMPNETGMISYALSYFGDMENRANIYAANCRLLGHRANVVLIRITMCRL